MEGGTDFDMTVLDQATEEERDGNRSRNNSESAPLERWGDTACLQTGEFFYANLFTDHVCVSLDINFVPCFIFCINFEFKETF